MILQTREPLLLNRDDQFDGLRNGSGRPPASYLGVPIVAGDEAIGVVSVQNIDHAGRFGEDEKRLLDHARQQRRRGDPERPAVSGRPSPGGRA